MNAAYLDWRKQVKIVHCIQCKKEMSVRTTSLEAETHFYKCGECAKKFHPELSVLYAR